MMEQEKFKNDRFLTSLIKSGYWTEQMPEESVWYFVNKKNTILIAFFWNRYEPVFFNLKMKD